MYISTRNLQSAKSLSAAIQAGLAADGGLFVPERIPSVDFASFSTEMNFPVFAQKVLAPFFSTDPFKEILPRWCEKAFHFPLGLKTLDSTISVLELFHGPTSSFKDFGASFLAEYLSATADSQQTIMVATSGDTGSAVASAFYRKANYRVIILYPAGQISARQEQQLSCWDENIFSFAVEGNFDCCQQLVKSAFKDPDWHNLSSANSINLGRLLPQLSYYAYAATVFFRHNGVKPGFIIPSGNFGNATAAYYAKAMGFPIREIVMATNANRVLVDYLENEYYEPRPSIATLANAMDVGHPSNMERLLQLFPNFVEFKKQVQAFSISDQTIRQTIKDIYKRYGYLSCPHTATAFSALEFLSQKQPWIVVATADPAKFDELIEPIIQEMIPLPLQLQTLLRKPFKIRRVKPSLKAIKEALLNRSA